MSVGEKAWATVCRILRKYQVAKLLSQDASFQELQSLRPVSGSGAEIQVTLRILLQI